MQDAFPVSVSRRPLVADTLPALKTVCFVHGPSIASRDVAKIYTYARLYGLDGELALSLTAFERDPDEDSRIAFAFGGEGDHFALAELSSKGARYALHPKAPAPRLWPNAGGQPLAAEPYAGVDEQGWYWGAHLCIPAAIAHGAGCDFTGSGTFRGALFKYRVGDDAYGASVPVANPADPLDFSGFGLFEVIHT